MRLLTFTELQTISKDYCIDGSSVNYDGLSDTEEFIKREINSAIKYIFSLMRQYKLEPPAHTFTTVASQADYNLPLSTIGVDTVTVMVSNIKYDLKPVYSQAEYDSLTKYPNPSAIPTRYFVDANKLYLFPKPQGAYSAVVTYNFQPRPLTFENIDTGTVDIVTAAGVTTVTTSTTIVDSTWIGKFFAATDGNDPTSYFYKIATTPTTSTFTLERVFEEGDDTSLTYLVGQSVEMPVELFEWIPWRVASIYYAIRRKEIEQAQAHNNMFFTGDFNNPNRKGNIKGGILLTLKQLQEMGHNNSNLLETSGDGGRNLYDGLWGIDTTL